MPAWRARLNAPVFATLGCRLNAWETEAMKTLAAQAGVSDAVVVNTCAVTQEAVRKAKQEIRRLARENPGARVVVTGCAAQVEPETFAAMPEVSLVLGNAEKMAPKEWARLGPDFVGETERVLVDDIMSVRETASHLIDGFGRGRGPMCRSRTAATTAAPSASSPLGGETRDPSGGRRGGPDRAARGPRVPRGRADRVDLTSWGADLPGAPRLGDLVMQVLRLVPGLARLRISSIDSIEADPRLMEAIATEPRLMPHLHLSLQAGHDLTLKRMKRRHLRDTRCASARRHGGCGPT
jgi:threonylcarbamoyladenosine tRNA methylthiotransferase MtaB